MTIDDLNRLRTRLTKQLKIISLYFDIKYLIRPRNRSVVSFQECLVRKSIRRIHLSRLPGISQYASPDFSHSVSFLTELCCSKYRCHIHDAHSSDSLFQTHWHLVRFQFSLFTFGSSLLSFAPESTDFTSTIPKLLRNFKKPCSVNAFVFPSATFSLVLTL